MAEDKQAKKDAEAQRKAADKSSKAASELAKKEAEAQRKAADKARKASKNY